MSNYNEQFLKQHPLAVLGVLRDLQKQQVPVRISWNGGQLISRILDASNERLVLDFGSQGGENQSVQRAEHIELGAETEGAKVEFALPGLTADEYQGLPAFVTPLPTALWFVQRREFFRISAPVQPACHCTAMMPDGSPLRFRLSDISVGGMGALAEGQLPEALSEGMMFPHCEVDLIEWGKYHFDMQLVTISNRTFVDSKNHTVSTPRLSFRFLNVNPSTERELQRIIFSLERAAHEKASRVR
ncbi:flagellar brake protein YcgR [Siccibacter turicensis]|uniref:flagellar brake protein YcgR n=1 Tax=Siccibacter turicensis TaxID=357233 RepID=UPI0023F0644A|nr:flagellar brake protein [Siccibacter turicensis]